MSPTQSFDAVVIGAGANGLVAAAALGQAGRRVLCVERDASIGGQSRLLDIMPGFRAPIGIDADWIPPAVSRLVGAVDVVAPDYSASVPLDGGAFLSLSTNAAKATESIRRHSVRDADRWREFTDTLHALAGFLSAMYQLPAADIDNTALREVPSLLGLGRKFRALGKKNMGELLRVLPIPAQDLLDDWFEHGPLKAALGAGAVRDIRQGPRSGGTSLILLHYLVGAAAGSVRGRPWLRGGPEAFIASAEQAARKHGVTIRTDAEVMRINVRDDAVSGVTLASGEEITAKLVLSTADPKRTFLQMVDPVWLDPEFMLEVRNIKMRGCTAVVHYALDRLPDAPGLADASKTLASIVTLTNSLDGLEKAYDASKYGRVSENLHVELSVPTLRWPQLAPAGKHVLVARVQYAPYALREGTWDAATANALGDRVTAAITRVMPQFGDTVVHRAVHSPAEIERIFALTEGAVTQGELTLDQIMFMRPVAGWGRYAMPVNGLYLGGAGTHPGPGLLGGPGLLAARRALAD